MGQRFKSVGAVLVGLLSGAALVMVLTFAATYLFFGGDVNAPPTPPYLAFNIAYSFGAAVLAGWVAARLAPSRPGTHAMLVALVMFGVSMGGGGATAEASPGVPGWYGTVLLVFMPLGALLGGWIQVRRPSRGD